MTFLALGVAQGQQSGSGGIIGYVKSEIDGSPANELQTISASGHNMVLSNSGGSVSVINTVAAVNSASTSVSVNLSSSRSRVIKINMSSASTSSTVNLSVSNGVTGGKYVFHFQNTSSLGHVLDFPTNFLQADGSAWDGGSTIVYDTDRYLSCYYDGTNYYCDGVLNIASPR